MKSYLLFKYFAFMLLIANSVAKMFISSPSELVQEVKNKYPEGIPYSIANYGDVPFGSTLSGNIYLPLVLQNCKKQPLSDPKASLTTNKIVLSARGDCTFTTKSLHSQSQGAKMAIIADNIVTEDPAKVVLVDDGRGPQVKIPTIFISEELGEMIQKYIVSGKNVNMAFRFDTNQQQKADVTLWLNSNDRKSYLLVRQLDAFFARIKQKINLEVQHTTIKCDNCPETDCYSQKEFCIYTKHFGYVFPGFGRQIIREQLREQIILQKYPQLWWKYMETYDDECDEKNAISECAIQTMLTLNIDPVMIEEEVQKTFQTKKIQDSQTNQTIEVMDNQVLRKSSQMKSKSGLVVFPAVVVNNITYRGNIEGLDIFQLVCNSLVEQPEGCSFTIEHPSTPWKIILIVIAVFVVFMIFLICCYRRKVRRQLSKDINKEVNSLVNQYITMYEAQKFQNKSESNEA